MRYAGDYKLDELKIHTTSGRSFDLTEVYVAIDIYEDIMSNAITGTLTFKDTNNLISNAPIIGQEQISLKVKTPQKTENEEIVIDFTENYLYVHKILNTQKINDYTQAVTISFTTFDVFTNSRVRISKVYEGMPQEIVTKIMRDDLKSKKNFYFQEAFNNIKMIFPNVKPFTAVGMVSKRAQSSTNAPSFLFYETCFGYNFRSLDNIYKEGKILGKYKQGISNLENKDISLETELSNIRNFRILQSKDNLINLMAGLYSSNLITYDWFTKIINKLPDGPNKHKVNSEYKFDYLKYFDKASTANRGKKISYGFYGNISNLSESYPLVSESTGFEGKICTEFPDAVVYLESESTDPKTGFFNKNFTDLEGKTYTNPYNPNNSKEWLMQRRSRLGLLDQGVIIEIEVNGTTNLRVGELVYLEIPNTTNFKNQPRQDVRLTGNFLITQLHHTFGFEEGGQQQKHIARMKVIRDDYSDEPLPSKPTRIDLGGAKDEQLT